MHAQNRRWGRFATAALGGVLVSASLAASPSASAAEGPYDPYFASPKVVADMGDKTRPFGLAVGDFTGDGIPDMVIGQTTGTIRFAKGNGDGTFATPVQYAWKQAYFNAWSFTPADVNGDGKLDVVWGATADIGQVHDGEVRAFLGNGDGTFRLDAADVISGVTYNAGLLLGDIGTDAGSLTAADIDNDGDDDVAAGAAQGVKILRQNADHSFAMQDFDTSGVYFPATSTQNSPWGLAFGDADGDGDQDLWVGDRALYVYLYTNDGTGVFTVTPGNISSLGSDRTNVYLRHDPTYRAAVGYTPSLTSADVNGDGRADLFVGLHSGTQTPTCTSCPHDGEILLDVSDGGRHSLLGSLGDIGTMARGLQTADVNADGATDLLGASYEGHVSLLRQLPPRDTDGDGISDYIDNATADPNAPRIDMNGDGTINAADQLDNDFDTVLGNPEDETTWARLGDPADPDDDNDGVNDGGDNCAFAANAGQADADGDGVGDKCDPLFDVDADGDGVPAMDPSDPLYEQARKAAARWSEGDTHFVIRIDALGRYFQNEFTQLMADAAILKPTEFAEKCWENYGAGDPTDPCGTNEGSPDLQTLTLDGGRDLPISLVTIPKMLWTDAPVIDWINDRNDSSNLDLAMHATYHTSNTMLGDWAGDSTKNFYSCEPCGLSLAENVELLGVGKDTLLGNYDNKWLEDSGATDSSPKIDWNSSANPLLSYAPPFNTDDTLGRQAVALLGFRAHSSSIHEERSTFFTPEGSHMESFDQFGLFHAAADVELDPPTTTDGAYDRGAYAQFLQDNTQDGGLNTWLIEEVEWSGRPCNDQERVGPNFENVTPDCGAAAGGATTNRENNTVYQPRWDAWLQLLDYVKNYDGGVVMTLADVALAKAFDNAPTVANPGQEDSDHDGIGDVVDGASLTADDAILSRNAAGNLTATLSNGATALTGQTVTFTFDVNGDGTDETYEATTDDHGTATWEVTPTRSVGTNAEFKVEWTDGGASATDTGTVTIGDVTSLELDASNPTSGQVTDPVEVSATLVDSDGEPVIGQSVDFAVGASSATGTTDASGVATATLTLSGPAEETDLTATFAGADLYGPSTGSSDFTVAKEDTTLVVGPPDKVKGTTTAPVTLQEQDGAGLANQTVRVFATTGKGRQARTTLIATVTTGSDGTATVTVPAKYNNAPLSATYAGDASFLATSTG